MVKKIFILLIAVLVSGVMITSCSDDSVSSEDDGGNQNQNSIIADAVSLKENQEFIAGDPISISVDQDKVPGTVTEVKFAFDGLLLATVNNHPFSTTINTDGVSEGTHDVKITVMFDARQVEELTISVAIKKSPVIEGTVTDVDGNKYKTIQIGAQIWMMENLRVSHYRNGDEIQNVTDDATWNSLTEGALCDYDNTEDSLLVYGKLYNQYAIKDPRGLAPEGWHISTREEFDDLIDFLGGSDYAAGRMKEVGNVHWHDGTYDSNEGTNESGFLALPAGWRIANGSFSNINKNAYFWTDHQYNSYSGDVNGWYRSLYMHENEIPDESFAHSYLGMSVRCVKNDGVTGNIAPALYINSPDNGLEVGQGETIKVKTDALDSDGTIEDVTFYFDSEIVGTVVEEPYDFDIDTENFTVGTHIIRVVARDNDGATTEKSITVKVVVVFEVITKSGNITEDETWKTETIYKLSDVNIKATVTIEAGCILKLSGKLKIYEGGKIIGNGTSEDPIYFTSRNKNIGGDNNNKDPKMDDWSRIEINNSGSVFNHCIFEYADKTFWPSKDKSFVITNSVFRYNYFGLHCSSTPGDGTVVGNCRFYENVTPMKITPHLYIGNTNTFTSEDGTLANLYQKIDLTDPYGGYYYNADITLAETELPFIPGQNIEISDNSILTLAEGAVLEMGKDREISIESGSDFVMKAGSYVTSVYDNTFFGGNGSVPDEDEYWLGIKDGSNWRENQENVLFSKYSSK